MKIEIGESLIASWLKHVYGCQIVQQNWKVSNFWDIRISEKEIQKTLQGLKKHFKGKEVEFISKKQKSSQMIKQGEIDCIGLNLEIDGDFKLYVNNIYAVDIAFHESGLNYGNIEATCERITKKYIRTALTIYQYFGIKDADIIFATPKTTNLVHYNRLKETATNVKNIFDELGFNFQFKLYSNEDFENEILLPLYLKVDKIADSSELFIRSLKLSNLFKTDKNVEMQDIKNSNKIAINDENFDAIKPKIAVLAKNIFIEFSKENKLNTEEIENLCDLEYSKKHFKIAIDLPILKKYQSNDSAFVNDRRRYYALIFEFNKKKYLLCNHWLENQYELLEKWINKISIN
jgi:hypothetical protein